MKEQWLEQGYNDFAKNGPTGLSINHMAREIGAARSSFYHYFAEIDFFVDELLTRHLEIVKEYNLSGKQNCKNLIPDLYNLLAQYPIPLKFNHQLFRNRHIPKYNLIFLTTYESSAEAFLLDLFDEYLDLNLPRKNLNHLFLTLVESWYSRLDPQDLSAAAIQSHAEDILNEISFLTRSRLFTSI
ncbi:TetR/AcrR family transcriptional regulator [Algoriphagus sp. SE2]|uniref:TetR/AcrR family transcriptional regulator n=1 Tax=Algoriphagus sp. SE2 TaxID=3141536 RepID=UPI0031CD5F3A